VLPSWDPVVWLQFHPESPKYCLKILLVCTVQYSPHVKILGELLKQNNVIEMQNKNAKAMH
jgi:hypothetical protein